MSKKLWIGAAIGAVVLFVGAYAGSPLLAASALRSAAMAGDADKLQRLVDFPAVRESLKGQLNAMIVQSMQSDPDLRDNPFAGLAAVMAPAIVNQAIEGYVTPDGIGAMMRAQKPMVAVGGPDASVQSGLSAQPKAKPASLPAFQHHYRDLDTYEIASVSPTNPDEHFSFILHRQGLFGWKLARIELPKTLMSKTAPSAAASDAGLAAPQPAPRPDALLARWGQENESCRGGAGDEAATEAACQARNRTDAELARAGWCYGENAAYGYQSEWRPCGSPRFASVQQAEQEAEADRAAHEQ
ncbi:MAG: DUF2939 domain-containing protein [Phenylobacterium sp.]|uniref:DUF2939 domain-containing protein n=1 Tax=Phenylobacterium sp. TaxID=1871053 RepID=UPI001A4C0AFB|nr:DUF2939 domain-containing protein [Phenylobacterium sp.]MBL8772213.1 DUF2939 domain-containing protein [Phenylobacterium sp.]